MNTGSWHYCYVSLWYLKNTFSTVSTVWLSWVGETFTATDTSTTAKALVRPRLTQQEMHVRMSSLDLRKKQQTKTTSKSLAVYFILL